MDTGPDVRGREVRPRVLTASRPLGLVRAGLAATIAVTALAVLPQGAAASSSLTGRLLVSFDDRPSVEETAAATAPRARSARARAHASAVERLLRRTDARAAGPSLPQLGTQVLAPPAGVAAGTFARVLRAVPGVARVELERRHELRGQPDDPALTAPDPFAPTAPLQWWAARTNLFAAWDVTRGEGAKVAVIDTGIDADHPEFAGRIAATVDEDPTSGSADVDEIGHGTHVASMACANAGNGLGIAGTGHDCKLIVVKSDLTDSSIARSIIEAADRGADAINMSFGTDGSRPAARAIVDAIDYAVEKDVVLVAAAADVPVEEQGDPSNVLQPTGTGSVLEKGKGLSVTAANVADRRASFAGRGSQISLAAYGAWNAPGGPPGIVGAFPGRSTELERSSLFVPGCGCRTTVAGDSRYAYLQGTSMAAPMVAGVAALVRDLNPDLSALEVVELLKKTARRPKGSGWNPELGWGILDAGAAVQAASRIDRRAPTSKLRRPRAPRDGRVTLRWKARDRAPEGLEASGVDKVEIWRRANGRKWRRIKTTRKSSYRMRVKAGSVYDFYTRAVDEDGNREAAPDDRDARVRVSSR